MNNGSYLARKVRRMCLLNMVETSASVNEVFLKQKGEIPSDFIIILNDVTALSQINTDTIEVSTPTEKTRYEIVTPGEATQQYLSANILDYIIYEENNQVKIMLNTENHASGFNYEIDFFVKSSLG